MSLISTLYNHSSAVNTILKMQEAVQSCHEQNGRPREDRNMMVTVDTYAAESLSILVLTETNAALNELDV